MSLPFVDRPRYRIHPSHEPESQWDDPGTLVCTRCLLTLRREMRLYVIAVHACEPGALTHVGGEPCQPTWPDDGKWGD